MLAGEFLPSNAISVFDMGSENEVAMVVSSDVGHGRGRGRRPPFGSKCRKFGQIRIIFGHSLIQNKRWLVINKWQLNLPVLQKFQENLIPRAFWHSCIKLHSYAQRWGHGVLEDILDLRFLVLDLECT